MSNDDYDYLKIEHSNNTPFTPLPIMGELKQNTERKYQIATGKEAWKDRPENIKKMRAATRHSWHKKKQISRLNCDLCTNNRKPRKYRSAVRKFFAQQGANTKQFTDALARED